MDGWNEVITMYKSGAVGILIFPYYMAYGKKQVGVIPPYSTLIYYFRIISSDASVNSTSLFYSYILNLDSIPEVSSNNVYYIPYFDGIGSEAQENSNAYIEYELSLLDNTIIDSSDNFQFTIGSNDVVEGLSEGMFFMNEGSMGQIIIPQEMAYGENQEGDIPPYSHLIYELRYLSDNPVVMEDSEIKKYFYENPKEPDSITNSNIYYFQTSDGEGEIPTENDEISLVYTAKVLKTKYKFVENDTIQIVLNTDNMINGLFEGIKLMKYGGKAKFIIPYSEGYGSEQHNDIPPYSTLFYEVELLIE